MVVDWSTSYQGGESSSPSRTDTDDDDSDDDELRGRIRLPATSTRTRAARPPGALSPIVSLFHRRRLVPDRTPVLPAQVELGCSLPFTRWRAELRMDSRRAGESLVLLGSLLFATRKIAREPSSAIAGEADFNTWIACELSILLAASTVYVLYTYGSLVPRAVPITPIPTAPNPRAPTPVNNNTASHNNNAPHPPQKQLPTKHRPDMDDNSTKFGFIWMSVPKNYRPSADDGLLTGLLLGPLVAAALLCASFAAAASGDADALPPGWAEGVEAPVRLPGRVGAQALTPAAALLRARYSLVSLATLTSAILLSHVGASRWWEERACERERRSVPRSEGLRGAYFILFALGVAGVGLLVRLAIGGVHGAWLRGAYLTPFDVTVGALFYQFTLYVALRMAHRGFTLGELALVCFGGTAVFMEFLNITIARIYPITTPFIKTFRLPTPLVIFQTALVAGPFLIGFLLAPFLVLSRHAAQTPLRRLQRRNALRARRRLALAFYTGALLVVLGPIGLWTRWCLGARDPWVYVVKYIMKRRRRAALLAYWGALGSVSVAGWTRQLARSRRWRGESMSGMSAMGAGGGMGMGGAGDALFAASGEFLDRAPTLGLNARRKFFHALVVVMFVPGVAFDPAFTHLAFSVAFALFVFAEYIRYFAIYPVGAAVHRFMNEFLDTKDGGTAILSHFYLLTGCAGALWLEGPTRLLQFTGVLVLGIGDALASIVGKRLGRHVWSPTTSKTLEGSAAFTLSVVASAWALRVCGLVEAFSTLRYVLVVAVASVLEALSDQNDNLTLPLYTWTALVLAGV
ncbi:hypothetical protein C8R43DRAFT_1092017 [Mycena crocata]|nr:hypothetical protein C8R43DRAFT_1092017 [Mycena crocata]